MCQVRPHRPPTSLRLFSSYRLVRKGGFEPPRSCERQPLKLVRLPVPPLSGGEGSGKSRTPHWVRLKPDATLAPAKAGHHIYFFSGCAGAGVGVDGVSAGAAGVVACGAGPAMPRMIEPGP